MLVTCAHCSLPVERPEEAVESFERGPDGQPIKVHVHVDCLEAWFDRTDPMPGRAP